MALVNARMPFNCGVSEERVATKRRRQGEREQKSRGRGLHWRKARPRFESSKRHEEWDQKWRVRFRGLTATPSVRPQSSTIKSHTQRTETAWLCLSSRDPSLTKVVSTKGCCFFLFDKSTRQPHVPLDTQFPCDTRPPNSRSRNHGELART